jgi:bacterioferritin-associated ferredoxin
MSRKKIVCFCEDVTEEEIRGAIEQGFRDIESLKRFTGTFMGPCQGKLCAMNVIRVFAEKTGKPIEDVGIPTLRPPIKPIPLGVLAAETERERTE